MAGLPVPRDPARRKMEQVGPEIPRPDIEVGRPHRRPEQVLAITELGLDTAALRFGERVDLRHGQRLGHLLDDGGFLIGPGSGRRGGHAQHRKYTAGAAHLDGSIEVGRDGRVADHQLLSIAARVRDTSSTRTISPARKAATVATARRCSSA